MFVRHISNVYKGHWHCLSEAEALFIRDVTLSLFIRDISIAYQSHKNHFSEA